MQKNNRFKKYGVSLIEIAVALLFFAFAAIPIYYALSYGSKQEVDTEKIAIANKILSSFRDEVISLPYDTAKGFFSATSAWKNIGSNVPQNSFQRLLTAQRKYKDFQFSGKVRLITNPVEALEFNAQIKWSTNGPKRLEKVAFVKVKK